MNDFVKDQTRGKIPEIIRENLVQRKFRINPKLFEKLIQPMYHFFWLTPYTWMPTGWSSRFAPSNSHFADFFVNGHLIKKRKDKALIILIFNTHFRSNFWKRTPNITITLPLMKSRSFLPGIKCSILSSKFYYFRSFPCHTRIHHSRSTFSFLKKSTDLPNS